MENLSSEIQNLKFITARIHHIDTDEIVGSGIVLSKNGLIATCMHVVRDSGVDPRTGKPFPNTFEMIRSSFSKRGNYSEENTKAEITIYFQWARNPEERKQKAITVCCFDKYDDDIVILKLNSGCLPEGIQPAEIDIGKYSINRFPKHEFKSLGYRSFGEQIGIEAWGIIVGIAGKAPNCQLDAILLQSQNINNGMSGAAVLDANRNKVIGLISAKSERVTGPDRDTGLAVDAAVLQLSPICEALREVKLFQEDILNEGIQDNYSRIASTDEPYRVLPVARRNEVSSYIGSFKISRAPDLLEEWVGRDKLLQTLDEEWLNSNRLIVSLIGFGGEGKSSLARYWINRLIESENPKPDRVFWWSFNDGQNIDQYFEALLSYLEPSIDLSEYKSASEKAQKINEFIRSNRFRCLLVIDGLETLQYKVGDEYGSLTNNNMRNWLQDFAKGGHQSFCLATTRIPLLDLISFKSSRPQEVESLDDDEGVNLLKKLGVTGEESELISLVRKWHGYALFLTLIATYIATQCGGIIANLPKDLSSIKNESKYKLISRILDFYHEVLWEEEAFLEFFSLFRLPVPQSALQFCLLEEGILSQDKEFQLKEALRLLTEYKILRFQSKENAYTVHPLIRNHYYEQIKAKRDEFKHYHLCISKYYKSITIASVGGRLSHLLPKIEAVHHLCCSDNYDEAYILFQEIYSQGLVRVFCAYETASNMLLDFFPNSDFSNYPYIEDSRKKNDVLREVAFLTKGLGKLEISSKYYDRAIQSCLSSSDFIGASICCRQLADLYIHLGKFSLAEELIDHSSSLLESHRSSINHESFSRKKIDLLAKKAWILHLRGDLKEASSLFQQAQALEIKKNKKKLKRQGYKYLWSTAGINHANHLLQVGEQLKYAYRIINENKKICDRNFWTSQISQCHCILGKLHILNEEYMEAQAAFNTAVQFAQKTSLMPVLLEALIARGTFWAQASYDETKAKSDLEEALELSVLWSYRIYEIDARLGMAWMHLHADRPSLAYEIAKQVCSASESIPYYWGIINAKKILDILVPNETANAL
jgi:hypothetical protein